jgi:hypothetical protein
VTVAGHLVEQGGIGGLAGSESESGSESLLGGLGGWEVTGIIFLGSFRSLEIPLLAKWLSLSVAFLDFLYSKRY